MSRPGDGTVSWLVLDGYPVMNKRRKLVIGSIVLLLGDFITEVVPSVGLFTVNLYVEERDSCL